MTEIRAASKGEAVIDNDAVFTGFKLKLSMMVFQVIVLKSCLSRVLQQLLEGPANICDPASM